ncbi:GSCOCG00000421001-RA-CDS [Cotesia congregata]|uniref:Uncharacterized protein n=1 Tax=Cotesia congregata TaxID=51543 RepID=A0A8J2MPN8_COTCN|nr:GSCOCG00000421001-RA-CDS [Cotesia congregata]CAG5088077.1 Protein of unknown function [Cotesia congregata]
MDKDLQQLQKAIVNYYLTLEKIYCYCNNEINKVKTGALTSLKNQMEQLRHVTSPAVDTAEICLINGAREKLIFKINLGIEDELKLIVEAISTLHNYTQELKDKYHQLEQARSKINFADPTIINFVNGTSERPRLNSLLEWSMESLEFYKNYYSDITASFKALNIKDEASVDRLIDSFNSSSKRIKKILAFTQYLNNKPR